MMTNIYYYISLSSSYNEKYFRQNLHRKSKHTLYAIIFFFENRAVYEIIWKNILAPGKPQVTIWRMHIACWIPKVTKTH